VCGVCCVSVCEVCGVCVVCWVSVCEVCGVCGVCWVSVCEVCVLCVCVWGVPMCVSVFVCVCVSVNVRVPACTFCWWASGDALESVFSFPLCLSSGD